LVTVVPEKHVCFTKYYLGEKIKEDENGQVMYHTFGGMRCIQNLVRKPEGKWPLGRQRDNIWMDCWEI